MYVEKPRGGFHTEKKILSIQSVGRRGGACNYWKLGGKK